MIIRSAHVSDLCLVDSGPAFPSAKFRGPGEGVRLLRGDNIEPGRLRWKNARSWPDQELPPFTHLLVQPGDLILGMDRPIISTGLKLAVVNEQDCPALLVQRVARIRPIDIDGRYLFHWLNAPPFAAHLTRSATGTQLPHVSLRSIRDYAVPRFEAAQERRIVAVLEDHLSRLDAASAYTRVARRRAETMIKSVLLKAIPDASTYPTTWRMSSVAGAGRVELGRQRHPDWHNGPNMHPYLRVANVFEDRIDSSDLMEMHWPEATFERFKLLPGDVLLNEGQTPELLGRPALYRGEPADVAFTNSLLRFRANDDVLPEFALLVFRRHMHAGRFTKESRITTNIAHLSASRLKGIEFPIPPLDEQASLVKEVADRLGAVKRLEEQIADMKVRAAVFRRALLAAAFEGKLTGRRTDQEVIEELAGV